MSNRSRPQQARSRERYERILDAAEDLFATTGYEATTTNAIAVAADTSIGSLYRFFDDKAAVLDAVVDRHNHALAEVWSGAAALETLRDVVDHVLRGLVDVLRLYPATRTLLFGSPTNAELAAASKRLHTPMVEAVSYGLAKKGVADDGLKARVCVDLVRGAVPAAVDSDGSVDLDVLGELRTAVVAYLEA